MKKLFIILFALIPLGLLSQQKGITTEVPDIQMQVIESKMIQATPSSIQTVTNEINIDYSKGWVILPSGTHYAIKFNSATEKLEIIKQPDYGVSNTVLDAVQSCPKWIQPVLLDNIRRIEKNRQEAFAQIILNAPSETRDEIAFQVAHLAPQTLNSIDTRLVSDNAEYIYTIAPDLQYVQLVENNSTDNWYTTTKYKVLKDGDSVWVEIPKDIYYWWIVMPKLSDEEPLMNSSVYNEFWRRHLYNVADNGYPLLKNVLKNIQVMWDCQSHQWANFDTLNNPIPFSDTLQALEVVGRWVGQTVWDKAAPPRPTQPNQILHDHDGNCGEMQDLFAAGARTSLMPVYSVGSIPGDHVWNELYWENDWWTCDVWRWRGPTNITKEFHYPEKGCISQWRGDGSLSLVNEHYQPVCTLTVKVVDQSKRPVDGAQVTLFSARYSDTHSTQLYRASWLYTDENGELEIQLGTNISYGLRADWNGGHGPAQSNKIYSLPWNQQGFVEGGHLTMTIPTGGSMPADLQITNQNVHGINHYKLNIDYQVPSRIIYGGGYWQVDFSLDNYQWNDFRNPGNVDFFICDEENYQKFLSGELFNGHRVNRNSSSNTLEFSLPEDKDYYIVYSNKTKNTTSQLLQTKAALYKNSSGNWNLIDTIGTVNTPTGLAYNETDKSMTVSVYSNPASDYITIKSPVNFDSDVSVGIFNNLGYQVIQKNYSNADISNFISINIKDLPSGIYFVTLQSRNYRGTTKFIVVK